MPCPARELPRPYRLSGRSHAEVLEVLGAEDIDGGQKPVKRFERKTKVANFVTDILQFDGYR